MIVVAVVALDWQEQCLLAVAYEIEIGRKKARLFSTYARHKKIGQAGEIRVHLLLKKSLSIANKSGSHQSISRAVTKSEA
jgi:hypothetical protein